MRTRILPVIALTGGLLVSLLGAPGAWAQVPVAQPAASGDSPACKDPDPSKKFTFNFHKIEVEKLAAIINQITCKDIIFEEKVRQKLTIFSQEEVTAEEAFELFQAALDAGGQYTLVPFRNGYKIILTRDSKGMGIPTYTARGDLSGESLIVTQMVRLKYVDAAELAQIFQQLVSRDASIVPYPPTNTLIITDTGANIRRLLEMVTAIDVQESEQKIEVISLQFASAADIAEKVAQILSGDAEQGGGTAGRTIRTTPTPRPPTPAGVPGGVTADVQISPGKQAKILAYERTNSLIVVAGKAEIDKVRELVKQLDFDAPPGRARFNVVHLKYARADEIVDVLAQLLGGGGGGGSSVSRRSLSGSSSSSRSSSGSSGSVPGIGTALGNSSSQLNRSDSPGASRAAAEPGEQFTGQVSITADPATNSIIVSASPEDFRILKPVIDELDVRRKQVFVEAAILEVVMDDSQTIGVQTSSIQGDGSVVSLVRSTLGETPIGAVLADPVTSFPAGFGAAITSTETVQLRDAQGNTIEVPAIAALVQALSANSRVNVLSTPHILTTDNEEAQIVVGQNVPFPTGTVFSSGGVNPVQTVERQDVGLTLRITPQISEGDFVRLDIFQEVSAVVPTADTTVLTQLGPTTTKRSAETRVVVRDKQTVVIGGLIQDRTTTIESKVPYLGDIPYLGWLFSVNTDRVEKVNLMILLTPRVIRQDDDLKTVTDNKRDDTDAFYRGIKTVNPLEKHMDDKRQQALDEPKPYSFVPPLRVDGQPTGASEMPPPASSRPLPTYTTPRRAEAAEPAPGGPGSLPPAAPPASDERRYVPPPDPPVGPGTAPPARLEVVPEAELRAPAAAERASPSAALAAAAPEAPLPVRARSGAIRAALGPIPPPGFESSPLEVSLQASTAKDVRILGMLVYLDGELVFSRHADTGVLDAPTPITLFVNGLGAGEHEVKVSLDVADSSQGTREVSASFRVAVPEEGRKLVRAKVLDARSSAHKGPTIVWTESEEAA